MGRQLKKYAEKAELPRHITPQALRHSIAVHYLIGGAPISFVQGLLGHESLETTGVYTRLVDHMTRDITLNTRTAVDGIESKSLREGTGFYAPGFEGWDAYVTDVLEWLGRL